MNENELEELSDETNTDVFLFGLMFVSVLTTTALIISRLM